MVFKKSRRPTEMVWGPEEPWVEPKKEVILGPAGTSQDVESASNSGETSLGFLSTMAGAAEASNEPTEERKSSPYGWEPSSSSYSSSSETSSIGDSDMTDKVFRLQRKIDNLVERIEALERKMDQ
jgi:hypothetical protein